MVEHAHAAHSPVSSATLAMYKYQENRMANRLRCRRVDGKLWPTRPGPGGLA